MITETPRWLKNAHKNFAAMSFDCYGTLIDWETGILQAIQPMLKSHKIQCSDQALLELYSKFEPDIQQTKGYRKYKDILQSVMIEFGEHFHLDFSQREKEALVHSVKDWPPFPDTVDSLQGLKRSFKLCVISNIDKDLFAETSKHLKVEFDWVITAEEAQSYKPSFNNFRLALEKMGLQVRNVLHVAQSLYHDIVPAKALGFRTVWVNRRKGLPGSGATKQADESADFEVPDLKTLVSLLHAARQGEE